jgi:hypothetical protein
MLSFAASRWPDIAHWRFSGRDCTFGTTTTSVAAIATGNPSPGESLTASTSIAGMATIIVVPPVMSQGAATGRAEAIEASTAPLHVAPTITTIARFVDTSLNARSTRRQTFFRPQRIR